MRMHTLRGLLGIYVKALRSGIYAHAHATRSIGHTWGLKADRGLSSKLAQTLSKSSGVRVCNTPCAHNTLHNPPATVFAFECVRCRHRKLQHPLLAYEVFSVHEPMVWSIGCTRDNCVVILKSGLKQAATRCQMAWRVLVITNLYSLFSAQEMNQQVGSIVLVSRLHLWRDTCIGTMQVMANG